MSNYESPDFHPRVFLSYASEDGHNDWVRALATRLQFHGIEVVLDQWDVALGADLPRFMETGLTGADRVVVVCSDRYLAKANGGTGGVGYEKKIMAAPMMTDADSSHVVPVLRGVSQEPPVPTFLSGSRYVDFRDDFKSDASYQELLYELYDQRIHPKPPLGRNPFATREPVLRAQQLRFDPTKFASEAFEGTVSYPYESNDGRFKIGSGTHAFTVDTSVAGPGSIHVLNDPADIATVALAVKTPLAAVGSPDLYDGSSRHRTARIGDSVVLVNTSGQVAGLEILEVTTRDTAPDHVATLTFTYAIKRVDSD